jgi:hypothetical protein
MSEGLHYEEPLPINRAEADVILAGSDEARICETLIRLAYHDPDWRWVQDLCLRFLQYPDRSVRGCAVTCLGHLARIHGTIDAAKVLPALRTLQTDIALAGRVDDAISDIEMFVNGSY